MILQALASYYERLAGGSNTQIPMEGFSNEKAHFALVLSMDGTLQQVVDLRQSTGRRLAPRTVTVPQGPKKSVQIEANFLWGNPSYVLGADEKGKPDRTADCHGAFKILHRKLLEHVADPGATAVLGFLSRWEPRKTEKLPYWQDMLKGNLVFQLDGETAFVHDRPSLKEVWLKSRQTRDQSHIGMCLISGEIGPMARLHPSIKGVKDAQSMGAAIVSFNKDSFCSYGKEQNYNAPVSETKAFAYSTALNHLLRAGSPNRIQIGDATTVFWTERDSPIEGFFGMVLDPRDTSADDKELHVFLESVREGKLPPGIDGGMRFFILGLSPNVSRLSVRFWHMSTVEDICCKLGQHFQDMRMIRSFDSDSEYPGVGRILWETYNHKGKDGPSPLLGGAIMRSILDGSPYPTALLSAVINRIRADQTVNYMRAAIIKAVLIRKYRVVNSRLEVPMSLDTCNKDAAYLLGRLFAVLERAQQDAIPGANTTIKDRFFGSASATPRVVFPQLLRLAQHHINKNKAEYGGYREKQIEEIISDIKEFPAHFGLEQQGLFAIGYYHQRQDLYKKKTENEAK